MLNFRYLKTICFLHPGYDLKNIFTTTSIKMRFMINGNENEARNEK